MENGVLGSVGHGAAPSHPVQNAPGSGEWGARNNGNRERGHELYSQRFRNPIHIAVCSSGIFALLGLWLQVDRQVGHGVQPPGSGSRGVFPVEGLIGLTEKGVHWLSPPWLGLVGPGAACPLQSLGGRRGLPTPPPATHSLSYSFFSLLLSFPSWSKCIERHVILYHFCLRFSFFLT